MNIAGLNNLAPSLKSAKPTKAERSSNEGQSSFEDMMSQQSQSSPSSTPSTVKPTPSKPSSSQAPTKFQTSNPAQGQSQAQSQAPMQSQAPAQRPTQAEPNLGSDEESSSVEDTELTQQGLPLAPTLPNVGDRLSSPPTPLSSGMPTSAKSSSSMVAGQEDGVDSLTRRVVWNDFLRKMKDDLGVSAEDVLKAFSDLTPEELAKPPAQTLDKIVLALGLNDQQSILAKQYFSELIRKTQSRSLGEELKTSSQQIDLTLMSQREVERKTLQSSLDRLNQNFFLKGPYARPQATNTPAKDLNLKQNVTPSSDQAGADFESRFVALSAGEGIPEQQVSTPPTGQIPTQAAQASMNSGRPELQKLMSEFNPSEAQPSEKSVDQLLQKFVNGQAASSAAKAKALNHLTASAAATAGNAALPLETLKAGGPQASPQLSAHNLNAMLATLKNSEGGDESLGDETTDASYLNMALASDGKLNAPLNTASDFQTQLTQVKPNEAMSVPDLVQQAQIMVRDGGGEMKVTMHPEGLGEVAMKVSVADGKVSVQMVTESDEAKKLIERQLGELKTSLTTNHLQVNDIKVDTATNLGKQLEQQYQDAQRQATQAQWEQFRQDSQGWRRSFFDTPPVREFKGEGEAVRDGKVPSASQSYANRARSTSRRLDLVA